MNKLTKIGASALCGSLAFAAAAHAGSMNVKGGATATYSSVGGANTGNPIGMNSGLTFTGTGELDNGTTFTLTLTDADQSAFSGGNINIVTPSFGSFKIYNSGGGGIDRYDDKMPSAWEETNGTAVGTGLQTVAGVGGKNHIDWTAPDGMLGDGLNLHVAYSMGAAGQGISNDKASSGDSLGVGRGYDIALSHTGVIDGGEVFIGYSNIEQAKTVVDGSGVTGDRSQYVYGFTYAVGSFTVGYQYSRDNLQSAGPSAVSFYENNAYGVTFQVNDDLSLSYGAHESEANKTNATNISNDAYSLQLAYSMGGASIKVAETHVDNANYTSGAANDIDGTTIALTLAF
jgi:outer membrane protein OmpU